MTCACPLCSSPNDPEALFCLACGASLEGVAGASPNDGSAVAEDGFAPLPAGTKVRDETLVLLQVLGQGGFGITYLAREFSSGRSVAVKELFPFGCVRQGGTVVPTSLLDADAWDAAREGFRREGALLTGHAHPNVVQVLDVWDERGTTLLAMEYLDGQTLAQVLEKGALNVRRVRAMIGQVGGALALLHGAGMLHRDIKPENIMLCRTDRAASPSLSPGPASHGGGATDRWVLLDFGAARAFAAGRTQSLTQIVTPGYAPLEQYASRARGGPPSDIYALAATVYHALTGVAPPPATERASHDELQAPESLNPNIPRALSQAIVRAMALRIDQRPPSMEAWLRELDGPPSAPAAGAPSPFAMPGSAPMPPPAAPSPVVPPLMGPAPREDAGNFGGAMELFERDIHNSSRFADERDSIYSEPRQVLAPHMEEVREGPMGRVEEAVRGRAWFRVTVTSRRIVWPKKCACCGGPMVLPLDVKTPAIWWQLPYCAACRDHAERGEGITFAGNTLALLALASGLVSLLFYGFWDMFALPLCALALVIKAVVEVVPLWMHANRRNSRCCSYGPAGRFKRREGDSYVWEFRSRAFAEEFCALNGGETRIESGAATRPVPSSPQSHEGRHRISN